MGMTATLVTRCDAIVTAGASSGLRRSLSQGCHEFVMQLAYAVGGTGERSPKSPATAGTEPLDALQHECATRQRAVSVHPQLGPQRAGRGHAQPLRQRALPRLFRRQPSARCGQSAEPDGAVRVGHLRRGPAQQELGRVRQPGCAADGSGDHRLRRLRPARSAPSGRACLRLRTGAIRTRRPWSATRNSASPRSARPCCRCAAASNC